MFSGKTVYLIIILIVIILLGRVRAQSLFFYPAPEYNATPKDHGFNYEEVYFSSGKNTLHGWFIKSINQPAKGLIFHLHGNAINMSNHFPLVSWLAEEGYNVFMFDYSGYGSSNGKAYSLKQVYTDSLNAFRKSLELKNNTEPLFIIGQSLGASLALSLMTEEELKKVSAAVFDSPFSGIRSVALDTLQPLPLPLFFKKLVCKILLPEPFSPVKGAKKTSVPSLLFHGINDSVIDVKHAKIIDSYLANNQTTIIPEGEHIDALLRIDIQNKILSFFDKHQNK